MVFLFAPPIDWPILYELNNLKRDIKMNKNYPEHWNNKISEYCSTFPVKMTSFKFKRLKVLSAPNSTKICHQENMPV